MASSITELRRFLFLKYDVVSAGLLEIQTRNSTVALLEKESAHPFGIRTAAGPIEVTRNDAGAIEDVQNGAGPTEVIDLNNTPPPKAKRKKHRPKVFKPPETPTSATPKPSKAMEEKPSGKRKYVRKNTPAGQTPPEQTGDSHCRSKPKSAKRCPNIDGDVPRESTHPGSQAQLISTDPEDYQQSESSTIQSNVQTQLPCHVGLTTSSMYSSANQMAGAQLLPADNTEQQFTVQPMKWPMHSFCLHVICQKEYYLTSIVLWIRYRMSMLILWTGLNNFFSQE